MMFTISDARLSSLHLEQSPSRGWASVPLQGIVAYRSVSPECARSAEFGYRFKVRISARQLVRRERH